MKKLGEMLIERGWLSAHQLRQALNHQKYFGGRLGSCLLELNLLSEERLLKALAEQLEVATVPYEELRTIDSTVLALVPSKVACQGRVVPFERSATGVSVAVVDSRDLGLQDELAFVTSKRVKVFVAPEVRVLEALEKHYECEVEMRFQRIWDRLNRARYLWQEETPSKAAGTEPSERGAGGSARSSTPSGSRAFEPPPALNESAAPESRPAPPLASPGTESPPTSGAAKPASSAPRTQPQPKPPRPTEVEIPEEFRAVLAPAAPARKQAPSSRATTLKELEDRFKAADQRDDIGESLLGFLLHRFARALLFMVRGGEVVGWMGGGEGVDQARLLAFELGFDIPSYFLNLREGSAFARGPLPRMEGHLRLAEIWGGKLPSEALMLPIRLRDRLVAVAYCDQGGGSLGAVDLARLQEVGSHTALAFEDLLRRKKRGQKVRG